MIYKLQRPVASFHEEPGDVMAYTETREEMIFMPLTKDLNELFQSRYKIYVEAELEGDKLAITGVVPDQDW